MIGQKILLTPLKRIPTLKGDVMHGLKAGDVGFVGFGEAYFSMVNRGAIKGWKRHRNMTLNFVCPLGAVRFLVHDGQSGLGNWLDVLLSPASDKHYQRLTVPPMLWVAFEGVGAADSMILNIASQPHDPQEADTADLSTFSWPETRNIT